MLASNYRVVSIFRLYSSSKNLLIVPYHKCTLYRVVIVVTISAEVSMRYMNFDNTLGNTKDVGAN